MTTTARLLTAVILAAGAGSARADSTELSAAAEPFQPTVYLAAAAGTTVAYRPAGGDGFAGPQRDVTTMAGIGVLARPEVAVELAVGPTLVAGEYAALSLMPGAVWVFDPHAFAAARVNFVIDPDPNVGLVAGFGLTHAFDSGVAPFVEADLVSNVGQGQPDLGVALAVGASFAP